MTDPKPAGPPKAAVWRTFHDALPAEGQAIYVRGDPDFREDVPYLYDCSTRNYPRMHVAAALDGNRIWSRGRLVSGTGSTAATYPSTRWTPADPQEAP